MNQTRATRSRIAGLVAAVATFGSFCAIAIAQPVPPPPPAQAPVLNGVIVAARPYRIQIRTRDGRYVELDLRNGTVINPPGAALSPGMRVAVRGVPGRNNAIVTDEIDVRGGPPGAIPNPGPVGPPGGALPPPGPPGGPPPPPHR
jgi:hypothetical protein